MKYAVIAILAAAILATLATISVADSDGGLATASDASAPVDGAGASTVAADAPAPVVDVEGDPIGSIEQFVAAVRSGNWKIVGAIALALLMFALAKVRNRIAFFRGDRGGALLVAVLGLAGGFSAALSSGAEIDWKLVAGIIMTTWTAVGGVTWVKRLVWPKDG